MQGYVIGTVTSLSPSKVSIRMSTSTQSVNLSLANLLKDNGQPAALTDVVLNQRVQVEYKEAVPVAGKLIPVYDPRAPALLRQPPFGVMRVKSSGSIGREAEVSTTDEMMEMFHNPVEGFSKTVFPMWVLSEHMDDGLQTIRICDEIEKRFSGFRISRSSITHNFYHALAVSLLQLLSFKSTLSSEVDRIHNLIVRYNSSAHLAIGTLQALRGMKSKNRGGLSWLHNFSDNGGLISAFTGCLKEITVGFAREHYNNSLSLDIQSIEEFLQDENPNNVIVTQVSKAIGVPVVVFVPTEVLGCIEYGGNGEGLTIVWDHEQYYVLVGERRLREERYDVYKCRFERSEQSTNP